MSIRGLMAAHGVDVDAISRLSIHDELSVARFALRETRAGRERLLDRKRELEIELGQVTEAVKQTADEITRLRLHVDELKSRTLPEQLEKSA